MEFQVTTTIDATGQKCPMPVLLAARGIKKLSPGEVMVLEATDAIASFKPSRGVSGAVADAIAIDSYPRMLSFYDGIEMEWGMRAEKSGKTALTEQYRSAEQMQAFVAGKCSECATVQFPQLQFCVNCHAPATAFVGVSLVDVPGKWS